MNERQDWSIIGGGILGMTLALKLARRGEDVTLYEAADHLGGLADAWEIGPVRWDRHYHVILMSDLETRAMLTDIGLEDDCNWVETRTGFYTDGQLYSMSNTLEFLKFPPLRLIDKLRLGATIFYASKLSNWKRLENIPVANWLRQLSGPRTTEKIWLPLLRAKLGENYRQTSAAFIWATIARMYAARRSGLKKEMFGYVNGGYHKILSTLTESLKQAGVSVKTGHSVKCITPVDNNRINLEFPGQKISTSHTVVTLPSRIAAHVSPALSDVEKSRLTNVQYQGIVCASLLTKKPLGGFYVTNITESWVPFTAVIEMTALVDPREFGGHALVYLPKYVASDDPLFESSDDQIEETFVTALERMIPQFSRGDMLAFKVSRARHVMAIPTLGYSENVPSMTTSIPGLFHVNSSQIVNGTLNVNESIKLANKALETVIYPQLESSSHETEANRQLVAGP